MLGVILKQFENPDEVRVFDKGKFEIVHPWRNDHRTSEL
jgi:hypothetical protein